MLNFRDYLFYSEKYLQFAEKELEKNNDADWLLLPATIMAWISIESFINNMLDDFGSLPEGMFQLHERAFLLESRLRFIDSGDKLGEFVLEGTEYHRLDEKIFFLISKFGSKKSRISRGDTLWQQFENFKKTRDNIVHPRRGKNVSLSVPQVRDFLETSKEIIQLVSKHVWSKEIDF